MYFYFIEMNYEKIIRWFDRAYGRTASEYSILRYLQLFYTACVPEKDKNMYATTLYEMEKEYRIPFLDPILFDIYKKGMSFNDVDFRKVKIHAHILLNQLRLWNQDVEFSKSNLDQVESLFIKTFKHLVLDRNIGLILK